MPEMKLELSRRNAFFEDPFFADLHTDLDDKHEKYLTEFSARTLGLTGSGLSEAAHNIQVSASNDKFQVQLELPGFAPEDFSLKTKDDLIIVEAVHEAKNDDGSSKMRKFNKHFKMPAGVMTEKLVSTYSGEGILTVEAPRVISAPEGAKVSEAMKAESKAFVTDDGVAVKKDDKASSQSIATTNQSEDGSTMSSFKSSSSSSSSSTMMSSGGPMPTSQIPMGMSNMDDMMGKMMSNMNMKSSTMKSSSSSSFSNSSSSSTSKIMSTNMGGMSLPPMRGMEMPNLSFKDMFNLPSSSNSSSSPEYTVTSPPMSPPAEMNHKVEKTKDYTPSTNDSPDTTVLLKFKEGSDFKLGLNMQQFSAEDISIKLRGKELTVEADNSEEQFYQKHQIPENIDMEQMESSFSSDGVLVIKAPKKI